ncbi:hypothetical protein [Pseudoxanthomonas sp. UTMC 1351]|uniref:hypothetical protein n=1 Tax=Pseudoxanthomonas sp. UTMC 1351 TaxID=2695853 RepID=UPI0034CDB806
MPPASFKAPNHSAEAFNNAPRPSIAVAETKNTPTALPAELVSARRMPSVAAFDTASSTAGPGLKAVTSDNVQNSDQAEKLIVIFSLLLLRATTSQPTPACR